MQRLMRYCWKLDGTRLQAHCRTSQQLDGIIIFCSTVL